MVLELSPVVRGMLAHLRGWGLALVLLAPAVSAAADARTDFLCKTLAKSTQFRVRVQAALGLGGLRPQPTVIKALSRALSDRHPAVRAAAASSLARLGDRRALPALRNASRDPDSKVRAAVSRALARLGEAGSGEGGGDGRPAFYVAVGVPGSSVRGLNQATLRGLRDHVVRTLSQMEGVVIAPEREAQATARRVLKRRKLVGYYIDSSVTKVDIRPDGSVRATVSVIVGTYPGRAMRAMLSGAATVSGGGAASRMRAIEAAFSGALRRLPQAMAAGRARASVP